MAPARMLRRLAGPLVLLILVATACSARVERAQPRATAARQVASIPRHALGTVTTTWIDPGRVTDAHGIVPTVPGRVLRTVYSYPAQGAAGAPAVLGAPPDRSGAPYPLVVFAHGFNSRPEDGQDQIAALVERGYVVAAPAFPLTTAEAVGGVDAGDLHNQPADVSFVITETLALARQPDGPLTGLVDPDAIAVGGHSAGAITSLGFASTCCRDARVKAVFVWAGNPQEFGGRYELRRSAPVLFVHGTEDPFLPYNEDVASFNRFHVPKVFLSLGGEDHASWAHRDDASFPVVMSTTADFLDTILRDDRLARARLERGGRDPRERVVADLAPPFRTTIRKLPTPALDRSVSVDATHDLVDGQTVTITWSDFTPGRVLNVLQCSGPGEVACDVSRGKVLYPDPTGAGSVTLTVHTGPIGTGRCGVDAPDCAIVVNDGGLRDQDATIRVPITFR